MSLACRKLFVALPAGVLVTLLGLNVSGFFPSCRGTPGPAAVTQVGVTMTIQEEQLARDLRTLLDILDGLDRLQATAEKLMEELGRSDPKIFTQEEDDIIRSRLLAYLNYRTALFRMLYQYRDYEKVSDDDLRVEAFLAAYASGLALFEKGLVFVESFKHNEKALRKLNEGDPKWGVPPGVFNSIRDNLSNGEHSELLREARASYETWAAPADLSRSGRSDQLETLKNRIDRMHESSIWAKFSPWDYKFQSLLDMAKSGARKPAYRVQSFMAVLLSSTKVPVRPAKAKFLITVAQVQELKKRLKTGDLILERRNWHLSNAFLPGFWPHAAIYVGTADDLRERGLDQDPFVAAKLALFEEKAADGNEHRVVEALKDGVIFTSLEQATLADYIAVLRPKLSDQKVNTAIARAFSHHGKPYDFEFDFFSTDRLVCTELVYRSFHDSLNFPLVDVMGRRTLPALEIVRKFAAEYETPKAELDFVLFLDGDEDRLKASYSTVEEFMRSADRSSFTWLN